MSVIAGFLALFVVYHLPEFFDRFWLMAVCRIGFLPVAFLLARYQGWKGLGGFGLGPVPHRLRILAIGLLAGILLFALSAAVTVWLGWEQIHLATDAGTIFRKLPLILLMTVIPSVDEDILTRGYLFGHWYQRGRTGAWVLFSATVFLGNHIWRLGDHPSVLVYLFAMGLALALAVSRTGNLWLAFGIHWGANIGYESAGAFTQTQPIAPDSYSNWVWAACWVLLLVGCLLLRKPVSRISQSAR